MLPSLSMPEMVVVMVVAVLLFGKRLPEVGRSLGKGIIEFKKGLNGVESNLDSRTKASAGYSEPRHLPDNPEPVVPKFEAPTVAPVHRGEETTSYQD